MFPAIKPWPMTVLDFGLFLASNLEARVLLESSVSPSEYRSCSLSARELGDLWDVPILFLDSLLGLEVTGLMANICKSPPSKLLHTGADLLLTSAFRGGLEGREAQEGGTARPVLGPCPRSDVGFGLTPAYERKHPPETKMTMEEFAMKEQVIKGDSQKADTNRHKACVAFRKWFACFMRGAWLRMGMVRIQNEALTLRLVLGICAEAEQIWGTACSDTKRTEMEDAVCFMLIGFGGDLRGEEVPLVLLEGLLNFRMETRMGTANKRYMMMTLSGRFKGEVDSRWHMVPISDRTHSNIHSNSGWKGSW
jgi:hypothetical protein